ncbi:unnamed protein product [Polarella glacialis]|uniref:Uncharacterized protein n=1 Tax=Polarella glacialis TaxID=89957 RepID=A0A813EGN9_POLGL|nr:unnamed protein product [Polarella glacialis]CAE8677699.1 unnamed protein product [Polarella glacialis]CAE8709067.1 unnamed protein product [Polarella glacialis]
MQAINRVLRQHKAPPPGSSHRSSIPVQLPNWCTPETSCVYISKSNGQAHNVKVEKCEDRHQTVLVRFEADRKVWKRVPYVEVKKFGDGTLRPLWKKTEVPTAPGKPENWIDIEDDSEKPGPMAEAVDPTVAGPEDDESPVEVAEEAPKKESPKKEEKKRPAEGSGEKEKKEKKHKK